MRGSLRTLCIAPKGPAPRGTSFGYRFSSTLAVCGWVLLSACSPPKAAPSGPARLLTKTSADALSGDPVAAAGGKKFDVAFEDRITLIGVKLPEQIKLGETLKGTLWFRVDGQIAAGKGPKVFFHGDVPGGEMPLINGDHFPAGGKLKDRKPAVGDVIEDTFTVRISERFSADRMLVRVGLYEGKHRWEVTKGKEKKSNRVSVGEVKMVGGPPAFPTVTANRLSAPLKIDGKLDEAEWKSAQRVGPFIAYNGRQRIKNKTWARLLWDDKNLYVGFECDDADIHTSYKERDDPIYKIEAVEIFIDADGDRDEYVELQAAPNDVQFDAAFKGGRRKNFDTTYDVAYTTKAVLDGSFNNPDDTDKGWVSEWSIPISQIRDVPAPPTVGTEWKINLFRLDKVRTLKNGKRKSTNEASAWSSPYSGDFHNLNRFGTLKFGGPAAPTPAGAAPAQAAQPAK